MAPKQDYTPSEGRRTTGVFAPRRNVLKAGSVSAPIPIGMDKM